MKETFERLNEAIIDSTISIADFAQSLKNLHNVFVCDEKWESEFITQPAAISTKWENEAKTLKPAICSCCGGRIGRENYCEYCGTRYW